MKPSRQKTLFIILALLLIAPAFFAFASELRWTKKVSPEIKYTHIKRVARGGPLHIHILEINIMSPKIKVRPAIAGDQIGKIEEVSSIARRENAIVAINGSFFESRKRPHLPVGILITNGKIINKSLLNRTAIGITLSGDAIFGVPKIKGEVINPKTREQFNIWGVNRPRKEHEVIFYTPEYGVSTRTNKWGKELVVSRGRVIEISQGNSKIPQDGCVISFHGWTRKYADQLPVGSEVVINFGLSGDWEMVNELVSGGPMLIKDGEIVVKDRVKEEIFVGYILNPTSRTAVGVNKRGELMMFVVDRRNGTSVGATFSELAKIMLDEGVVNGMALDGGGPSTMYVDGEIKNFPLYGYPVRVSNALIVEREGYRYVAKAPKPAAKPKPIVPLVLADVTFEAGEIPVGYVFLYELDLEDFYSFDAMTERTAVSLEATGLIDELDRWIALPNATTEGSK